MIGAHGESRSVRAERHTSWYQGRIKQDALPGKLIPVWFVAQFCIGAGRLIVRLRRRTRDKLLEARLCERR